MRAFPALLGALLCAVTLNACGERDKDLERGFAFLDQPVTLDDQIVMVDSAAPSAFVLDLKRTTLDASAREIPLPHDPHVALRRNGKNEALILCLGRRGTRTEELEPAVLVSLDTAGKLRRYVLGDPFDSLVQSDDGRYAFLFKSTNTQRVLQDPNEVAFVDLTREPSADGAVAFPKLRSFSDSPVGVVFSPPMQILDSERRLAVVLSNSNVTLIDLTNIDRQVTTIQLSTTGGTPIQPMQVLFGANEARIYVRGTGSSDVFAFNLIARPPDDAEPDDGKPHNDFRPFIDQLGVGGAPTDMALYGDGEATRLVALRGAGREIALVNPGTSEVTSVMLAAPASQLLLFDASSPHGAEVQRRALLYQLGTSSIAFLDLFDLETRRAQNLEALALDRPIIKLIPLLSEHLALVIHDMGGASLIDLAQRTISPIRSDVALQDALFDPQLRRLWVGPPGYDRVGFLDLDKGATGEVQLDAPIQRLLPMFARGQVVVLHDSSVGYATVLSAKDPGRATAQSVRGFLITDLLERGR